MNLKLLSSVVGAVALLGACSETSDMSSGDVETASQFMTQSQLLATIPGATLYGTSSNDGKTHWVQKYSKGGTSGAISGLWGGAPYTSTWSVKGDMWCEKGDDFDACWSMLRVKDKELQPYKDGTEKLKNPWFIK